MVLKGRECNKVIDTPSYHSLNQSWSVFFADNNEKLIISSKYSNYVYVTRNKCNILNLFKCKRYKPCKVQNMCKLYTSFPSSFPHPPFALLLLSWLPGQPLPSKIATFWLTALKLPIWFRDTDWFCISEIFEKKKIV